MTENWTDGPWSIDRDYRPGMAWNNHIVAANGDRICFMAHSGEADNIEGEANARLIAVALDLYHELEKAVEIIKEHVPDDALGVGGGICPEPGHPDQTWSIKEEHLFYMERALEKAKGGGA